jgi:phosphatidylglycerophosphatase A
MEKPRFPFMAKLPDWLVNGVATVCGLGYLKPAPGTIGSLVGTLFYALCLRGLGLAASLGVIVALFLAGWVFCDDSERRMGKTDPGCIIWDEFAAMPVVFLGLAAPAGGWQFVLFLLAGFGLFRFFDILKPIGISKLQYLPGGLGIMADDTAAALASCALMHAGMFALSCLA